MARKLITTSPNAANAVNAAYSYAQPILVPPSILPSPHSTDPQDQLELKQELWTGRKQLRRSQQPTTNPFLHQRNERVCFLPHTDPESFHQRPKSNDPRLNPLGDLWTPLALGDEEYQQALLSAIHDYLKRYWAGWLSERGYIPKGPPAATWIATYLNNENYRTPHGNMIEPWMIYRYVRLNPELYLALEAPEGHNERRRRQPFNAIQREYFTKDKELDRTALGLDDTFKVLETPKP